MFFNSLSFALFFVCFLCVHNLPLGWTAKKINLLLASYIFYAAWNPPFILLLWISTLVDWYAADRLYRAQKPAARRLWLALSVLVNLGMLVYFKYGEFLAQNLVAVASTFGITLPPAHFDIVLPVGISFYTFATMSYTLDVYRGHAPPARNFLDYALFVTFFPHLVAGPIMRPAELLPQFATPRRATSHQILFGIGLVTLGLFNKVVLADTFLATVAEQVYDGTAAPGWLDAWVATCAFGAQIFCDFAGYSTIAIGVAMSIGFAMPGNFRLPYAAIGLSDFWRRWHITLSAWLRDYVYIPLGGNRHGEMRASAAVMGTMLLGGLWHGASWTFVAWGGLHGLYLCGERVVRRASHAFRPGVLSLALAAATTYVLVHVAWVFFRAKDFARATQVLRGMLGVNADVKPILSSYQLATASAIVLAVVATHWLMRGRTLEQVVARTPPLVLSVFWAAMAVSVILAQGSDNAFIYFQF